MVAPVVAPPHAPLPIEHARAARRAGALGGAMVGVGLPIACSPALAWAIVGIQSWAMSLPARDPEPGSEEAREVVALMLQALASPLGIALAVLCVLVGGALVAFGVLTSVRRLRRAGVHRPVAVTLLGLLLARVGTWILGSFLGGLPEMLLAAWMPPLFGVALDGVFDGDAGAPPSLVFAIATAIVVLLGVVAAAGVWLGTGLLTTWWMAIALRERVPMAPTHAWPAAGPQPWPTDARPAAPAPAPQDGAPTA